ncbi:MAG TPA: histidine phosphatase family protein [Gemmatimonadales bacterium]|jgi:broad specificity phosphatase PhoE|nr:histidine phosphatase family protein [Gemmatimonadales bacterium]
MLRRAALALWFACLAGIGVAQAQNAPLTVFVVRHGEKGPEVPDPSLNETGRKRAAELARMLGDAKVTALFVTEFKRTQEFLAPLAAATGVTPVRLLARDVDALIEQLAALPAGSRAVVASHSNLVHVIVQRLSGVVLPQLTDLDYDHIVVVTVTGKEKGTAVVLRYGEK